MKFAFVILGLFAFVGVTLASSEMETDDEGMFLSNISDDDMMSDMSDEVPMVTDEDLMSYTDEDEMYN